MQRLRLEMNAHSGAAAPAGESPGRPARPNSFAGRVLDSWWGQEDQGIQDKTYREIHCELISVRKLSQGIVHDASEVRLRKYDTEHRKARDTRSMWLPISAILCLNSRIEVQRSTSNFPNQSKTSSL
jgi:hypothetical protein